MPDSFDFSQSKPKKVNDLMQSPLLTYLLCGLCILITACHYMTEQLPGTIWHRIGQFGYVPPSEIWSGRYYGLFTALFLHLGVFHLLFNMVWLWRLGRAIELAIPPLYYALFCVAATVVGSGAELAFSGTTGTGASGLVYGLFGLMWAGRGRFKEWRALATRENLNLFLVWGLLCVFLTYANIMPIANFAHGAGFLFGLSVGRVFLAPRRQPLWAIPMAALVLLTALSVTWLPWSGDWTLWKGNRELIARHYRSALDWYQRSLRLGMDPAALWYNSSLAWGGIAEDEMQRNNPEGAQRAIAQERIAARKADAFDRQDARQSVQEQTEESPKDALLRSLHDREKRQNVP
jgi:membrane associated rhomboid family serine protease